MALLEQLDRICQAYPAHEKWLIVPQRQYGGTLLRGLSRAGKAWFNVRVHTLEELLNSQFDVPEPCPPALFPFWEVSRELPPDVVAALDRLRCDGADVGRLAELPHPVKRRHVQEAFEVLEELYATGVLSRFHFYEAALKAVENSPALNGILVVVGTLEVNKMEADLLRALAAKVAHVEVLLEPGASIAGTAGEALRAHPAEKSDAAGMETQFIRAVSPESEVYAILQTMQEHGMHLEDVEIAMAQPDVYRDIVRAACVRAEVPLSVSMGTPVGHTRVGQLVRALGKMVSESRNGIFPLLDLLRSGFSPKNIIRDVKNVKAAHRLKDLVSTSGNDRPPIAFLRYLAGHCAETLHISFAEGEACVRDLLQGKEREHKVEKDDLTLLEGLQDLYQQFPKANTSFGHLVQTLRTWLTRAVDEDLRRGEDATERSAYNRVMSRLSNVEQRAGDVLVDSEQGMETLLDYVLQGSVEGQMPKAGHVHLVALPFAGLSGRPIRFVVGLDDGVGWSTSAKDRWLRREDRELLGAVVLDAEERAKQIALRALYRPCAQRFLSYAVLNLVDRSELAPSPVYLEALRETYGSANEEILHTKPRFVDLLPQRDRAYHANDHPLAAPSQDFIHSAFPQTARGIQGHTERMSDAPSVFNGTLGFPLDLRYDPFGTAENPSSATRLNTLAQSGFASFLRDVLRIRLSEEDQMRDTGWPTALHKGLAVHELLKTVVDGSISHPDEVVEHYLKEFVQRRPPPTDDDEQAFRRYLTRMLSVFIALERDKPRSTRTFTEVELALADDKYIALQLSEGETVYLKGRIDRVDRTLQGDTVIDYKTGKAKTFVENRDWLNVGELQWALYAFAASRMYDHPTTHAGYVLLGEEHFGLRLLKKVPEKEQLANILSASRMAFMKGYLTHTAKSVPLQYAPESWVRPPQNNPLSEE